MSNEELFQELKILPSITEQCKAILGDKDITYTKRAM
jgi:hypothetical protein